VVEEDTVAGEHVVGLTIVFDDPEAIELSNTVRASGVEGVDEVGINKKTCVPIIKINPHYFRPTEIDLLLGDASKAKEKLGWEPQTKFSELAKLMTRADYELMQKTGGEFWY
jgi:GDP-D-mannose dehydratase